MRAVWPGWLLLLGCGRVPAQAELRDLQQRLATSERARVELAHKVEELESKVFLMGDRLEGQRVDAARRAPPRLPVVTLRPTTPPPEEPPPESSTIGEAPPRGQLPRPMVRLEGRPLPAVRPSPIPRTSMPGASVTTASAAGAALDVPNLGVMKLPDKGVPIHHDAAVPAPAPTVSEPLTLYRAAYAHLSSGRSDEAAGAFRDFVRRFPRHDYADNAQYWLAETFYARKDYGAAATEFRLVIERWPAGNKAPDALLKLGFCLLAMERLAEGRETLLQVSEQFPHTEASQLATRRLAELGTSKK